MLINSVADNRTKMRYQNAKPQNFESLKTQVLICLASFVAVASASHLVAPAAVPAAVSTGTSSQYRSQNSLGDYTFGYNEDHATGGTFRREAGNAAGKTGSYGLRVADGRTRIVNYVADAAGFRANIQTNEPGVEPKDPAATLINKAAVVAAPAPVAVAAPAPVAVAAPAPAPVAVAAPAPAPVAFAAPAPLAAPAPVAFAPAAPLAAPLALAPPAAFSYNSVVSHLAGPVALPAYAPAPLPAAAPLRAF